VAASLALKVGKTTLPACWLLLCVGCIFLTGLFFFPLHFHFIMLPLGR